MKEHDDPGHVLCMWFLNERNKVVWHMRPLIEWIHHEGYKNATSKLNSRNPASSTPAAANRGSSKVAAAKPATAKSAAKPAAAKTATAKTAAKTSGRKR